MLRCKGAVNYLVDLHDTRKRERTLHVNMLKPWHLPSVSGYAEAGDGNESGDDYPEWSGDGTGQPTIGKQLTEDERVELHAVLLNLQMCYAASPAVPPKWLTGSTVVPQNP